MNSTHTIQQRSSRRGAMYAIQCTKTKVCLRVAIGMSAVCLFVANTWL